LFDLDAFSGNFSAFSMIVHMWLLVYYIISEILCFGNELKVSLANLVLFSVFPLLKIVL